MKILLASLLFLPLLAQAEQKVDIAALKHPVNACLFKVEGNGLKKTSYLFGTIHLADPRVVNLHPNAKAAFKDTDAFYAEIDRSISIDIVGRRSGLHGRGSCDDAGCRSHSP